MLFWEPSPYFSHLVVCIDKYQGRQGKKPRRRIGALKDLITELTLKRKEQWKGDEYNFQGLKEILNCPEG